MDFGVTRIKFFAKKMSMSFNSCTLTIFNMYLSDILNKVKSR